MPNQWDIPMGEEPTDVEDRLTEAGRLVAQDLRTAFPSASVSLAFDDAGDPFLELSGIGCLTPIWVVVDERQSVYIVAVTEAVLDSALFDDHPTPWPVCPFHPLASHSLRPVARGDEAAWICPESHATVARIGELAAGQV